MTCCTSEEPLFATRDKVRDSDLLATSKRLRSGESGGGDNVPPKSAVSFDARSACSEVSAGSPPPAGSRIWDLWMSQHHLVAVAVALQLGVFELVENHAGSMPLSSADVARVLGLVTRGAEALIEVLAAMGHLTVDPDRRLTGLGEDARAFLVQSCPGFWGPMLCSTMVSQQDRLLTALRDGGECTRVTQAWAAGEMDNKRAEAIVLCMHSHSAAIAPAVMKAARPILQSACSLLDMAGGSGVFMLEAAQAYERLSCTVAELPSVVAILKIPEDFRTRLRLLAIDMFRDTWPTGHDVHFLSNVLHDWDDEACLALLRRCRTALPHGGRLILNEALLLDNGCAGPLTTACLSLHMFLYSQGKQRTLQELRLLLEAAGFQGVVQLPVGGTYFSLVCATAAPRWDHDEPGPQDA